MRRCAYGYVLSFSVARPTSILPPSRSATRCNASKFSTSSLTTSGFSALSSLECVSERCGKRATNASHASSARCPLSPHWPPRKAPHRRHRVCHLSRRLGSPQILSWDLSPLATCALLLRRAPPFFFYLPLPACPTDSGTPCGRTWRPHRARRLLQHGVSPRPQTRLERRPFTGHFETR